MTTATLNTRGPEESSQPAPATDRVTTGEPTARTLRVQQKTWESDGVTSVTFADPSGAQLAPWQPGSHLSLHLPNGLVREYSLCSDPLDSTSWTVAVLRTPDSRGGSQLVHEGLPVGALLKVEGPRNNFALEDAGRYVLVAGGIGITPIISMARQLHAAGADWSLLYTGRSRATMAFLPEIGTLPQDRITIHADDEANGSYPDRRPEPGCAGLHLWSGTAAEGCCRSHAGRSAAPNRAVQGTRKSCRRGAKRISV